MLSRIPSPNGKMVAVVFGKDCGATTSISYHVSILASGESLPEKGNILVADKSSGYSEKFKPVWHGNHELEVIIPPKARVFTKNNQLYGVNLTFKQL